MSLPSPLGGTTDRYRTIPRVPIFDQHDPVTKTVASPRHVSPENPAGHVAVVIGATDDDLHALARNSNVRVAEGKLPSLQLGHTLGWDAPESWQPKHVGFAHNFVVAEHEGRAHLFADLTYLADQYDEATTYPRCSIERSNWQDPPHQFVRHVALLRCPPGRDLAVIPYSQGPNESDAVPTVAGADFPIPVPDPVLLSSSAGTARMDPELLQSLFATQTQAIIAGMGDVFTKAIAELKPAADSAVVVDPAAVEASGDPADADPAMVYAMSALGGNAGVIPGIVPAKPEQRKEYLQACVGQHQAVANYSKSLGTVAEKQRGIETLLGELKAQVAGLVSNQVATDATVRNLAAEQDAADAKYKAEEQDRILDAAEERGVQFDRARVLEIANKIPAYEDRIAYLREVDAHYKQIPLNGSLIPTGHLPGRKGGNEVDDAAFREARRNFGTRHHIFDPGKLAREYTFADFQAGKV